MPFLVKNDGFTCLQCGEINPPAQKTCRNHCKKCFCSLHVDEEFPGDRASKCGGVMRIVDVLADGKKDFILFHKCEKCGKEIKNKIAEDDDTEAMFVILKSIRKG